MARDEKLLLDASRDGDVAAVRALLGTVDIEARDELGRSSLFLASEEDHVQVVELLLDAGADPNAAALDKRTPLHCACASFHSEVARLLLTFGSEIHAKDSESLEPLHVCVKRDPYSDLTLQTLQVLVSFGATWDAGCEEIVATSKIRAQAEALRLCVLTWTQEHADGLPFTHMAMEIIKRGPEQTQTYIEEVKKPTQIKCRRKICVVGPSKAGKTTLIKSITARQPSLVHPEDRTIGVDQIVLRFGVEAPDNRTLLHDVTFWGFAGQDEYQVAHSLFFSARTLYLVCVDLEAFLTAYKQTHLMAHSKTPSEPLMNEFIERTILRWVRLIFSHQPDAEFAFIATKKDMVSNDLAFTEEVKAVIAAKLEQVEGIVGEMKRELIDQVADGERRADTLTLHSYEKRVAMLRASESVQATTSNEDLCERVVDSNAVEDVATGKRDLLYVSCSDVDSVEQARRAILKLIVNSERSFMMPDVYTDVSNAIAVIRQAAHADASVSQTLVPVDSLVDTLMDKIPYMDKTVFVSILQTLHDLGDVLWYETLGIEFFEKTVILDPLLLVDFVRQVINHNNKTEKLTHGELKGLPLWVNLDSKEQFLAIKQLLQKFHVVHPSGGEMKWDSDLIVPAFWKSKTPASLRFGCEDVRLDGTSQTNDSNPPEEQVRVHWKHHFAHGFPDAFFDQLIVDTHLSHIDRDLGPDWVLYAKAGTYACRAMVSLDGRNVHRVLHLEAVLAKKADEAQVDELWEAFECLSEGIVKVLRRYPGIVVTVVALDDEKRTCDLESLAALPLKGNSRIWMPRTESWELYKRVVGYGATGKEP